VEVEAYVGVVGEGVEEVTTMARRCRAIQALPPQA
jgi:hypothetical protein